MPMNEREVLAALAKGYDDAEDLLVERFPRIHQRWSRLCRSMVTFLADVKKEFPDAEYYTGSGGFNLLLGASHAHDVRCSPQQELLALHDRHGVTVSDGDW